MLRAIATILLAAASALAHPGIGIVVDSKQNVYYTDLSHVWRIDPQGRVTKAVANVHTHELYLDAQDVLYGEHLWYTGPQDGSGKWFYRTWNRMPDGSVAEVIPPTEGFRGNYSFVRDPQGNMYAAGADEGSERRYIRRITPDGNSAILAGGERGFADGRGAEARFEAISWMAFGGDGNLYAVDDGKVRQITPDGVVTTPARDLFERRLRGVFTAVARRHHAMGIWVDREGNIYIANHGGGEVNKITPRGQFSVLLRADLPYLPTGVTVSNGAVYVLEYGGTMARVRRLAPDGTASILAGPQMTAARKIALTALVLGLQFWPVVLACLGLMIAGLIALWFRRRRRALPLFLIALPLAAQPAHAAGQDALAIVHVTVIDTAGGRARQDMTVVVSGDRIATVGRSGAIAPPRRARVLDGSGKFLIPGLWDMHTHAGGDELSRQTRLPELHNWRREIASGALSGPRMIIASRIVDGPESFVSDTKVAAAPEARQAVRQARREGANFVKIRGRLSAKELARHAEAGLGNAGPRVVRETPDGQAGAVDGTVPIACCYVASSSRKSQMLICQSGFHGRSHPQAAVNPNKVVPGEV